MPHSQTSPKAVEPSRLTFGIYPGLTGGEEGLSGANRYDPIRTEAALQRLQSPGQPFLVRAYALYEGEDGPETLFPPDVFRYLHDGRQLDLALCYRSPAGDVAGWTRFIRQTVRQHAAHLATLQITEEPNSSGPGGNGGFPNVRSAVIDGVFAARDEARQQRLEVCIGFNATPSFNPADDFWPAIATHGGAAFAEALDYVGLDFFPDVFRPIAPANLRPAVEGVLTHFRTANLGAAALPATVPIRITENGWPTGPNRSPERQAEVLETVVRAVHALRGPLNITHYEFFTLRDASSSDPTALHQFGLLREDYSPKPAFETYRRLIEELTAASAPQ